MNAAAAAAAAPRARVLVKCCNATCTETNPVHFEYKKAVVITKNPMIRVSSDE